MFSTHSQHNRFLIIVFSLVGLILISANNSRYWQLLDGKIAPFDGHEVNGDQVFQGPMLAGDMDGNGALECLNLSGESVQITNCSTAILWQSPAEWRVTEAQVGDLNRDRVDEVILLVWRPFQPWPVDRFTPYGGRIDTFHDDQGNSCQVILVGWQRGAFRELWAGSAMIRPLFNLTLADLDHDGRQELAALESTYEKPGQAIALTVWGWQGFGFTLIDRLEGPFQDLQIGADDFNTWLITR